MICRLIFRNRLGRTLKLIRVAHGLSQSQLAAKMFTTRQVVSNLERGESLPNVETFERACVALNVAPSTMLYFAEAEDAERILEAA